MERVLIYTIAVYFLLGFNIVLSAAGEVKKTPDKDAAAAIAADAREIKKEAVKTYRESKEAIVREVKEAKEEIPKDLKKAKDSAIQQSREIKESVKHELKEIRDGMTNPSLKTKPESR